MKFFVRKMEKRKERGRELQEEITQKTFALMIRTSKLTEGVLEQAIKNYLQAQKQRQTQPKRGKQSVKELIGQNAGVSNLEITSGNLRCFEQVARKYRVDFAVKKIGQQNHRNI